MNPRALGASGGSTSLPPRACTIGNPAHEPGELGVAWDILAEGVRGELRVGRRVEKFTATEVPVQDRPRVLRAYLKKWKFEVGMFFQGVGPDAPEDKLLAIAPDHPVFQIRS